MKPTLPAPRLPACPPARLPAYDRKALTPGIVHIGLGNFHRAHMAVYLDDLFALGEGHDWAIPGAGVREGDARMRAALMAQDCLSTVIELDPKGWSARRIGSLIGFLPVEPDHAALIAAMTRPQIERAMAQAFGIEDPVPVTCEPFRQWVLEDHFPQGRPALEKVGVTLTPDVHAYERMKIRILNGGHATITCPGGLMDIEYVHEAMAHPLIRGFLDKVGTEDIIPCVPPVPDTDIAAYYRLIVERFSNPDVADTERRLCFDGSNRQPKFIIPSVRDALAAGGRIDGLALVSALWCRYCHGTTDSGTPIPANDPNWDYLQAQSRAAMDAPVIWLQMKPIYGDLNRDPRFVAAFTKALNSLWENGTPKTLANYIAS